MSKLPLVRQKGSVVSKAKELVDNIGNWREKALGGQLRSKTTIRSIYWKIFLGILNESTTDNWIAEITRRRKEYENLLNKWYKFDPKKVDEEDLSVNNPLSVSTENVWGEFFKDKELKKKISIDLDRLFPEYRFFQTKKIHETLLKILFIWSKKNPDYSYKQGFHDILGVLYLVCNRDSNHLEGEIIPEHLTQYSDIIHVVCDPRYVEHDSYLMLNKILIKIRKYYGRKEREEDGGGRRRRGRGGGMKQSPIFVIGERIQNDLLKTIDPPLFDHLELHSIQPQVYLLKWVRLLFLRVFHLDDVIIIWDAFLAHHEEFQNGSDNLSSDLIEHICLNMVMYIRNKLLANSVVKCLEFLMTKYPDVEDTYVFYKNAKKTLHNPTRQMFARKPKKKKKKNISSIHRAKPQIHNQPGLSGATKRLIDGENMSERLAKKFGVSSGPSNRTFESGGNKLSAMEPQQPKKETKSQKINPSLKKHTKKSGYGANNVTKARKTTKTSSNPATGGGGSSIASNFFKTLGNVGRQNQPKKKAVISSPKVHRRTFVRKSDVDSSKGKQKTKSIQKSSSIGRRHPLSSPKHQKTPEKRKKGRNIISPSSAKNFLKKVKPKKPKISGWSVIANKDSSNTPRGGDNLSPSEYVEREYELGMLMDELLYLVQQEVELGKKTMDMDVVLLSVAQLKHIKDVLIGGIEFDRPTIGRLRKQNQEFRKMIEEKKVLKRIQEKKDAVLPAAPPTKPKFGMDSAGLGVKDGRPVKARNKRMEKLFDDDIGIDSPLSMQFNENRQVFDSDNPLGGNIDNNQNQVDGNDGENKTSYDPFQSSFDDEDYEEGNKSKSPTDQLEEDESIGGIDDEEDENRSRNDSLRYVEEGEEDEIVDDEDKAAIMDEIGIGPSAGSFEFEGVNDFSGGISGPDDTPKKQTEKEKKKKPEIRDRNYFEEDEDEDEDPLNGMLTMDGDFDGMNNDSNLTNDIDAIFGDL